MSYELIKNAHVTVQKVFEYRATKPQAEITINDKYVHRFPRTSRISQHLDVMEPDALAERLSGGQYFVIDDHLVDFRDNQYIGFVHSDDAISKLIDVIGYSSNPTMKFGVDNLELASKIQMQHEWNNSEISVPGFHQGGEFNSILSYRWSPFVKTVNSIFGIVRLICTNGAVMTSPIVNAKVPLFNRWEEHLDIAARQIQNKVSRIIERRVQIISNKRASVADCNLLVQHCNGRILHSDDPDDIAMLIKIRDAVDPMVNLSGIYQQSAIMNGTVSSFLPAHLTKYDAYNIATEIRSHTHQTTDSSARALDIYATKLLIGDANPHTSTSSDNSAIIQTTTVGTASFADRERAFYGKQ